MKHMITILIAEDNEELGKAMCAYLNTQMDMEVVGIAKNGNDTLKLIELLKPSLVLLDIIMPGIDGIGVLERMADGKAVNRPMVVVVSGIANDLFIRKAMQLGAEYYIVKPFDMQLLAVRIRQLFMTKVPVKTKSRLNSVPKGQKTDVKSEKQEISLEVEVSNIIKGTGISPHMLGYPYILEAVMEILQEQGPFFCASRVIYPCIAKKFNTTPEKVERAIRNTLSSACAKGMTAEMESLLSKTYDRKKRWPTNTEFFTAVVEKVKLSRLL